MLIFWGEILIIARAFTDLACLRCRLCRSQEVYTDRFFRRSNSCHVFHCSRSGASRDGQPLSTIFGLRSFLLCCVSFFNVTLTFILHGVLEPAFSSLSVLQCFTTGNGISDITIDSRLPYKIIYLLWNKICRCWKVLMLECIKAVLFQYRWSLSFNAGLSP